MSLRRLIVLAKLLRHLLGKPCGAKRYGIDCSTRVLLPPLSNGEILVFSGCVTRLAIWQCSPKIFLNDKLLFPHNALCPCNLRACALFCLEISHYWFILLLSSQIGERMLKWAPGRHHYSPDMHTNGSSVYRFTRDTNRGRTRQLGAIPKLWITNLCFGHVSQHIWLVLQTPDFRKWPGYLAINGVRTMKCACLFWRGCMGWSLNGSRPILFVIDQSGPHGRICLHATDGVIPWEWLLCMNINYIV